MFVNMQKVFNFTKQISKKKKKRQYPDDEFQEPRKIQNLSSQCRPQNNLILLEKEKQKTFLCVYQQKEEFCN